jgi:hypothetical protein
MHREWVKEGKVGLLFKRQIVYGFFEVVVLGRGVVYFRLIVFLYASDSLSSSMLGSNVYYSLLSPSMRLAGSSGSMPSAVATATVMASL